MKNNGFDREEYLVIGDAIVRKDAIVAMLFREAQDIPPSDRKIVEIYLTTGAKIVLNSESVKGQMSQILSDFADLSVIGS